MGRRRKRGAVAILAQVRSVLAQDLGVSHAWMEGRLFGIRLARQGPIEQDIYILSGYAPMNEVSHARIGEDHHVKTDHRRAVPNKFWDTCRAALNQLLQRVADAPPPSSARSRPSVRSTRRQPDADPEGRPDDGRSAGDGHLGVREGRYGRSRERRLPRTSQRK